MLETVEKIFKKKETHYRPMELKELSGMHIAFLATDGFEKAELFEPKKALENAGASVYIVSLHSGKIRSWDVHRWGQYIDVDLTVREAWAMEFDALVLPGGALNPDKLRSNPEAVAFVMSFVNKKRPIAAICHGIQTLIEANVIKGKKVTSWPSIKTDVQNAGGTWYDKEVVIDNNIITARKPGDIPAFNEAMIREFSQNKIHPTLPSTEGYSAIL